MHERRLRYRVEAGVPCIDVGVENVERLLDRRDPAPFRDRDLDPGLVEYLVDAAEDLGSHARLRVVFWLREGAPSHEVEVAFRGHFEDMLHRVRRRNQQRLRFGASALLVGLVLLVLLFSLAQLIERTLTGTLGSALAEGAVILSWIVLWRPVELLLFDWIPVRQERRTVIRLLGADVAVRVGSAPEGSIQGTKP
jgi:hypothetical protein